MSSADLDINVAGDPEELRNAGSSHRGRHGLHGRLDAGQQLSQVTWQGKLYKTPCFVLRMKGGQRKTRI
jgi:hypothetical protein